MFDLLCQLSVYTSLYCIYAFSWILERDFTLIGQIYSFIFGETGGMSDAEEKKYINNVTLLLLPHLIMIWTKTIIGFRAWLNNFTRKSVESYFMHTFIYHIFSLISNILIFTLHPRRYGSFILTNICITASIGFAVTYTLYKFLVFKDKDARLHQELWCGNIMDSSDAE